MGHNYSNECIYMGVWWPNPFLSTKKIMDGSMANQQGAPRSKGCLPPCHWGQCRFRIRNLDVESEILDVATALAARARLATSMCAYLLPPERLAALSPANRLKLLRKHLSRLQNRLTQDSALAPRQNETDQMLRATRCETQSKMLRISSIDSESKQRFLGGFGVVNSRTL